MDGAGPEAVCGLNGLLFLDLLGTAASHSNLADLPLDDLATIRGWGSKRVTEIDSRSVTGKAIAMGMITRLQKARNRRSTENPQEHPVENPLENPGVPDEVEGTQIQ